MQGGGWCRSPADCAGRSVSDLGSSKKYTPNKTSTQMQSQSGAMVRNSDSNPQMHNWNHVWIKYCDGNSFTGNNASTSEVPVSGKSPVTLYYRGSLILDATIESLLANPLRPLSAATVSQPSSRFLTLLPARYLVYIACVSDREGCVKTGAVRRLSLGAAVRGGWQRLSIVIAGRSTLSPPRRDTPASQIAASSSITRAGRSPHASRITATTRVWSGHTVSPRLI